MSRHFAPVNAYGATEFIYRHDYLPFDALTPAEQQFISTVASAAIAGDTAAIRSQLRFAPEHHGRYTMWNGYKIEIYSRAPYMDETGDEITSISMEMRPENGTGYYVHIFNSEKADLSLETDDSWHDYYQTEDILSCPCMDWQWNGPVTGREYNERLWRDTDGTTCHTTETTQSSGTMVDSLREGTSTVTRREIQDWSPDGPDDTDETTTTTRVYRGGILVEENGEPWEHGQGYHPINAWSGGGIVYHDDQLFLDERYW